MKKIQVFLALFLFIFAFMACDPSDTNGSNHQNDDTFAQNFGNSVSRNFIGQVVDTNNQPIINATVKIGTSTAQTDVNGVFIINGAGVHEKFAYITVLKPGYLNASRSLVPTTGKNNVKIMMIQNVPTETVQSGVASEVALPSGTKVSFDGEFQDENGNSYSGSVSVSLYHLLPGNENIDKLMPGMLYAQTKDNKEAVLETFGMLNVELRGSSGQKLNIKEGHTAQITMKIDDSQTATAPGTIPLWHFDEEKGYWKEDGEATKVGNNYVGVVSHFSWWNCDTPFSAVLLSTRVVDSQGNPLGNIRVYLAANDGIPRIGSTDDNGRVSGLIPANLALTLTIHNDCNVIYTANIGPFTSDTVLPDIVISNTPSAISTTVNGTLLKCDNTNVTNGYVLLRKNGNVTLAPVSNGTFSFDQVYCAGDTNFSLNGVDYDNLQQTNSINYNLTPVTTTIGSLQACNAISEFISYQINNEPVQVFATDGNYFYMAAVASAPSIRAEVYDNVNSPNAEISINGNVNTPGIYTPANSHFSIMINAHPIIGYGPFTNEVVFNVSNVGAIGDYIDMSFSGSYADINGPEGSTSTITGTVHVIRRF